MRTVYKTPAEWGKVFIGEKLMVDTYIYKKKVFEGWNNISIDNCKKGKAIGNIAFFDYFDYYDSDQPIGFTRDYYLYPDLINSRPIETHRFTLDGKRIR